MTEDAGRKEQRIRGILNKHLEMGRLEKRPDRFGQPIPAPSQKRGEEAKQTEDLNQRRKKDVKNCRTSGSSQSQLVTHHVIV